VGYRCPKNINGHEDKSSYWIGEKPVVLAGYSIRAIETFYSSHGCSNQPAQYYGKIVKYGKK